MNPPWLLTMASAVERPSPVPLPTSLVVKNGSKTRSRMPGGMPLPVSVTLDHHVRSGAWRRMFIAAYVSSSTTFSARW